MKVNGFYEEVHEKKVGIDLERTSRDKIGKILDLLCDSRGLLLDVGCGDGSITELFNNRQNIVLGVDVSKATAKIAKSRGVEVTVSDVNAGLPFRNGCFDYIFAGSLIEHLFNVDFFLDEVRRILKPNAFFLVTTPNLAWFPNRILLLMGFQPLFTEPSYRYDVTAFFKRKKVDVAAGHLHLFTLRSLIELLKLNDFIIEKIVGSYIIEHRIMERHGIKNPVLIKLLGVFDHLLSYFPSVSAEILVLARKIER
jgi:SAM-dependent methyltransferase